MVFVEVGGEVVVEGVVEVVAKVVVVEVVEDAVFFSSEVVVWSIEVDVTSPIFI